MTNDRCTRRVFGQRFARAAVGTAIAPFAVSQTKPKQLPRVGFLIESSFPTMVEAFRSELRQLGHVEGQSLALEMRLSRPNTNDLASQVQELAAMDLDVVVAAALPVALAFRKLNTSTPMVGRVPHWLATAWPRARTGRGRRQPVSTSCRQDSPHAV